LPEISPKPIREIYLDGLREDIEALQIDLGIYTRLKETATEPDHLEMLAGLIQDTITLINAYHQEIKK